MVALLWAQVKPEAAIDLERFWNRLAEVHRFSLLCAYPMRTFCRQEQGDALRHICDAHSKVFPAESFHGGSMDELHRTIVALQQKAMALESEVARRQQIESVLQRREKELSELDKRKDEFLAMLGHALRNPLTPIFTSLELMHLHGGDTEQFPRWLGIITRQVSLMARLVDDLLDVSRITRGKIELKPEKLKLDRIVERAVEIARPLIDERRHTLSLNLPADPPSLVGDPARLAQVLANLLHNAAKYTKAGGRIALSATTENGWLQLAVRDSGIGMSDDLRDKVFDLFVQGPHSHGRSRGGLGLGLTLVRSLVQMHGGTVQARSGGEGCGSEFIVMLPLPQEQEPSCAADAVPHAPPSIAGAKTILIADDNIDAAESLGEFLKASDHKVHLAHDGAGAIEEAARIQPEVVILDIGMPGMSGYQVARRLRSDIGLTSALLVAVTGYAQEQDRAHAQQAGFDHHFAKPLDIAKLAALLSVHAKE